MFESPLIGFIGAIQSSSYFSDPVNEVSLTYDIGLIDEGFSVGSKETKEKK